MITFNIVDREEVKTACIVFNWEEGLYEFLIEGDDGYVKRKIFSGNISYLKEVLRRALNEISKGEGK